MRFVRTTLIAAAATAALAGAAAAAKDGANMMLVALPDGSVQHIRYQGEIAPQVVFVRQAAPVSLIEAAFGPASPFAEMERISAAMNAQAEAMMRQAMMQPRPAGQGVVMTNAQGEPVVVMHYSYVSTTTSADGCTRTISYSSDGATAGQPKLIQTSSGSCASARPAPAIAPAAKAKAAPVIQTRATPAAKPAPRITPVSATKTVPEFTPSIVI